MIKELKVFTSKSVTRVSNEATNKAFCLKGHLIYVSADKLAFADTMGIKKPKNAFRLYYYYIIKGIKGRANIKSGFYYILYINVNLDNLEPRINLWTILKKFSQMLIK